MSVQCAVDAIASKSFRLTAQNVTLAHHQNDCAKKESFNFIRIINWWAYDIVEESSKSVHSWLDRNLMPEWNEWIHFVDIDRYLLTTGHWQRIYLRRSNHSRLSNEFFNMCNKKKRRFKNLKSIFSWNVCFEPIYLLHLLCINCVLINNFQTPKFDAVDFVS